MNPTVGAIALGKTVTILDLSTSAAGSKTVEASMESDSVLVSLFADTVSSGTLDVVVWTLTENGKEVPVISFPSLGSPTSQLLLKKAAVVMSRIKIVATYTGSCTFEVRARGINSGETSVKILGASNGKASQKSISTVDTLLPVSLLDRSGILIKNFSPTGILYIGYTAGEAVSGSGYPLGPGDQLGIDLASGATLYGVASTGTIDVRIMEASA